MKRRALIVSAGAGLVLAIAGALAQQRTRLWRVGYLASVPRQREFDVFREAMRGLGYVEGRDVAYERRVTHGANPPLAGLAAELLELKIDIFVTFGTPATQAAQKATTKVPIVMVYTGDPVGSGLVSSLAHPGGNITGVANLNIEINAKRIDLLVQTIPKLSRLAALLNPSNATYQANVDGFKAAAQRARLTLLPFTATTLGEIERAFSAMRQQKAEAVVGHIDSLFSSYAREIGGLATRFGLPLIGHREMVKYGALMSYEPDVPGHFVRAAGYVDRILKGANPAELPVEQPTKFDLTVSLKAAKALGITIPREVLLLADEVVQQ